MMPKVTTFKLLKREDWPDWFDFIKSKAEMAEIWTFIDPADSNPPLNVKPDRDYYTRSRPITNDSNEMNINTESPVNPQLEQLLAGLDPPRR